MYVVALFNVVFPNIFNVDANVEGLLKLTIKGGFNIALKFKFVNAAPEPTILPARFNDDSNVDALETNILVKLVLLFKLLIDHVELVDRRFK
jgi:hypothetical protein